MGASISFKGYPKQFKQLQAYNNKHNAKYINQPLNYLFKPDDNNADRLKLTEILLQSIHLLPAEIIDIIVDYTLLCGYIDDTINYTHYLTVLANDDYSHIGSLAETYVNLNLLHNLQNISHTQDNIIYLKSESNGCSSGNCNHIYGERKHGIYRLNVHTYDSLQCVDNGGLYC